MDSVGVKDLGAIGEVLSGAAAVVLAVIAFFARDSYHRQVSLDQMKWLQQLYDSFYNTDHYKAVRQLIDFEDIEKTVELARQADINPSQLSVPDRTKVDAFTDYLNFFEWIGYLEAEGQLTFKQVEAMFKYYLVRILQVDKERKIREYLRRHSYEQLNRLLNHYSPTEG